MFQLLTIYGLTFSSVGLLSLALFPSAQQKLTRYMTDRVSEANTQLSNMFIELPAKRLKLAFAAAPTIGALVGMAFLGKLVGLLVGAAAGFALPRIALGLIAANRRRRFTMQLVDALLVLSSSLKAGLSLLQSLEVLAEEAQPPTSQEVGLVTKETRMGLSLDEALKRLGKRMPIDELKLAVTAMLVARETGGDISELFARLIETIRERQKIKERIKTLTVIPRMQGWVMAIIPFAFGSFAVKITPGYFDMIFHDPVGRLVGLAAVVCWVVALLLILWFSRPPK